MSDNPSLIGALASPFPAERPSVLTIVRAAIAERGAASRELRVELPDDESQDTERLRFVAGALDALTGKDESATQTKARTLAATITKLLRQPSTAALEALWRLLRHGKTTTIVDETLKRLAPEIDQRRETLAALARRLVAEAPDIETVKMGIALLGVSGVATDRAIVQEIGQSDEFTMFSAVALANLLEEPEREIWALAKSVHGWGRIAAVERLASAKAAEIRRWLLRDGFRNSIMHEYLAYIAATSGEMLTALSAPAIDDDLLLAAAEILSALIRGGPAEDIENYEDGPGACVAFLEHALVRDAPALAVVSAVTAIRSLCEEDRKEDLKALPNWSAQSFLDIRARTAAFLQKPGARAAVDAGLRSEESWGEYFVAAQLAPQFGIDAWPFHFDRQARRIGEHWWHLMQTDDVARIDRVLALARDQLDLEQVGSGPSNALGVGPAYRDDGAVDFIVQELRRFPGRGQDFIDIGLRGRTVRLRHMTLNALREWGRTYWPAGIDDKLNAALTREPQQDVRSKIELLLHSQR